MWLYYNEYDLWEGKETTLTNILGKLTSDDINHFKFTPITSVDVERNYSTHTNSDWDNRRSFMFENTKQYFIVQCNAQQFIDKIA